MDCSDKRYCEEVVKDKEQVCSCCQLTKPLVEFCRSTQMKSGFKKICLKCNRDKAAEYRSKNREAVNERVRKWKRVHAGKKVNRPARTKEYWNDYQKEWRSRNREKLYALNEEWRKSEHGRKWLREYNKSYLDGNLNAKITRRTCTRIIAALRKADRKKENRTLDILGCTIQFFRRWIEHQFWNGMSWSNYGNKCGQWSFDHIRPCNSFNLADPGHRKACFHWSNIQPLWVEHNSSKSDTILDPLDFQI